MVLGFFVYELLATYTERVITTHKRPQFREIAPSEKRGVPLVIGQHG